MPNLWCRLIAWAIVFAVPLAAVQIAAAGDGSGTRIIIGTATARPGELASVAVTLATDVDVTGVQNDIASTPPVRIAARANGRPDCELNPDFGVRGGTAFAFLPLGCDAATTCTGVRALVLALNNTEGIPDGSLLYTCAVAIPVDTPAGSYPLEIANVAAADPAGEPTEASGTSGAVIVEGPTPTPTITPGPASFEDDGCAITAGASRWPWWLLAPLIVSWMYRRRRRNS
jgi:hypothetical protein